MPFCQEVMRARCIENRVYAVTANRVGTETAAGGRSETFTGLSQVVDPDGEVLVRASTDREEEAVVDIDPAAARSKTVTDRNHLFTDRRPDFYRTLIAPASDEG